MHARTKFLHATHSPWPRTSEDPTAPPAQSRRGTSRSVAFTLPPCGGSKALPAPNKVPSEGIGVGLDIDRCRTLVDASMPGSVGFLRDICLGAVLNQTRRLGGREIWR